MRLLENLSKIKTLFVKKGGIALCLLLTVAFASCVSNHEFQKVRLWAASGFADSQTNAAHIAHLETEVKTQAAKPTPPPVIIVQKETTYEKPFANRDLLDRARKLRHEQKSSTDNR